MIHIKEKNLVAANKSFGGTSLPDITGTHLHLIESCFGIDMKITTETSADSLWGTKPRENYFLVADSHSSTLAIQVVRQSLSLSLSNQV